MSIDLNRPDLLRVSPLRRLVTILRSPAIGTAAVFAAGGLGFAVGNVLLARVLPAAEYGFVALFLSLIQIGITLGPLGLPTSINRHHLSASLGILNRATVTSAVAALALAAIAVFLYEFQLSLAAVLAFTVITAGVNRVASAFFQSRQKFGLSLFLILVPNWVLLCAVPIVLLADGPTALPVAIVTTVGYLALAIAGWKQAFSSAGENRVSVAANVLTHEGLAVVGFQLALTMLFQLDRLIIPHSLSIEDLATYSVVAAIAGSPYRMLQVGVGYTLLPKLRVCKTRAGAWLLIRHEGLATLFMAAIATFGVIAFTPWIMRSFLADQYTLAPGLVLAIVIVGFVRVWNSFSSSVVSALASARQLMILNVCGWLAIALATGCAAWAARYGLVGVVYGLGAGWFLLSLTATFIAVYALAAWPQAAALTDVQRNSAEI